MIIKSAYHKTDEMLPFDGKYFYSNKKDFNQSDVIFVISAKRNVHSARTLTPYLEGKFGVIDVDSGNFTFGSEFFTYRSTLKAIHKPGSPIEISDIQHRMGIKAFASRYLNQPKPILESKEVEQFESLLQELKVTSNEGSEAHFSDDLAGILDSDTERQSLIMARIGQGKFRENVRDTWGYHREVCAATLLDMPEMLTASHIIPWRECRGDRAGLRWDGANGILLSAHLDRLFDRYLISFKKSGGSCSIIYSRQISDDVKSALNLTADLEVTPNLMSKEDKQRFFSHMQHHYERFVEFEEFRRTGVDK